MPAQEIHYRIPWRARGNFPGHHASAQRGAGLDFINHAALIDAPDPRRFDVRASLRDPFGNVQVRVYRQRASVAVIVVADLSASMGFRGERSRFQVLADFAEGLAHSAFRTGDSFGLVGCGDAATPALLLPPTMNRAAGLETLGRLRAMQPIAPGASGLLAAADYLGSRRALVFLVSDFHLPLADLERVIARMNHHDVVPVMLGDRAEHERLPRFGLARVIDSETGAARLLFMRGALRRAIATRFAERQRTLRALFARSGREPLILQDGFDADAVSRYFLG